MTEKTKTDRAVYLGNIMQNAGSTIATHKLHAETVNLSWADSAARLEVGTGGDNLRELVKWAQWLKIDTINVERRPELVNFDIEAERDGVVWAVRGVLPRTATPGRGRFPGITVNWHRREISNTASERGVITLPQLQVLLSHTGRA